VKTCEARLAEQERAVKAVPEGTAQPPAAAPQAATTAETAPAKDASAPAPSPAGEPAHATEPPPVRRSWVFDPLGDALLVVGVGGLATGGVFLALGDGGMTDAAKQPTYHDYSSSVDQAHLRQRIGVVAISGGALLTSLAIWRFAAVGARNAREKSALDRVSVAPTPGGAWASYQLTF
jgi:hypothetical protein